MKEIKWLALAIEAELEDAEKYAKAAHQYRDTDKELSRACASIAEEEINHAMRLHKEAERMIKTYRAEGHEAPESMKAIWDWEHEKMVDHIARIRHMLAMLNA